jgi:hypothetical protein
MVMAVVEKGKDPKAAAKEASDKIVSGHHRTRRRERAARQARGAGSAMVGCSLPVWPVPGLSPFTLFPVGYNVWLGFFTKHSLRAHQHLGGSGQLHADPC